MIVLNKNIGKKYRYPTDKKKDNINIVLVYINEKKAVISHNGF